MQQHAVPQNIASFEFKLVGELTLKQFAFLASGGVLAYLMYISILPPVLKWPLVALFGFGGAAFALIPMEQRPLHQWFINFFKAIFSPTQRIWKKHGQMPGFLAQSGPQKLLPAMPMPVMQNRQQLEHYLATIPTAKNPLDMAEEQFLGRLPFDQTVKPQPPPPAAPTTTVISQEQAAPQSTAFPPLVRIKQFIGEITLPHRPQAPSVAAIPNPPPATTLFKLPGLEARPVTPSPAPPVSPPAPQAPVEQKFEPKVLPIASEINFATQPVIAIHTPDAKTTFIPEIGQVRVRKLHSVAPLAEISLPIRGEKRLEISPEFQKRLRATTDTSSLIFERSVAKPPPTPPVPPTTIRPSPPPPPQPAPKTPPEMPAKPTVMVFKPQIPQQKPPTTPKPPMFPQPPLPPSVIPPPTMDYATRQEVLATTSKINQLIKENQRFVQQIQLLKQELSGKSSAAATDPYLRSLQQNLIQARQEKEAAINQIAQLQSMLVQMSSQTGQPVYIPRPRGKPPRVIEQATKDITSPPPTPPQPRIANVIAGLAQDDNGSPVDGVVIVVYDHKRTPVRAFKTNRLGQFTIATPLPNGTYTIEFEKNNMAFDILELELKGELLDPIIVKTKSPPNR